MGIFWFFFALLLILHQDFWNWSSQRFVFWGMPIGLFYHTVFSLSCSLLGFYAVVRAWPEYWEKYAEDPESSSESGESQSTDEDPAP